jgi:peptide/nickel transport system substrate-binding protein
MAFNQSKELANSKTFRQACNWAIDRVAIQAVIYLNTGSVAFDPFLPGAPFHDPGYKPFARDLSRVARLIEESGVKTPITLEVALSQDPVKRKVGQIVQQNLAEIGVQLEFRQVDAASHTALIEAGDFVFDPGWGWFGYRPDPDQYLYILGHSKGSRNIGRYNNPEADQLLTAQRSATSEGERRTLFRKVAELLSEDAVYISYHYGSDFKLRNPGLQGFVHRADGIIRYDELALV